MTTNINVGGRPVLSDEEKRSKVIKFSCTKAEFDFFKLHAENAGYKQIARFLHDVNIEVIESGKFSYNEQTRLNSVLISTLTGLANNVNQAMRYLHTQDIMEFPNLYASIQECQNVILGMAQIAQLGIRRDCHIEDQEPDSSEVSDGNA